MNTKLKRTLIGCAVTLTACGIVLYTSLNSNATTNPTLTADQVTTKIQAAGLPITGIVNYTAATDTNHLLGRPGGYTSKTSFTDPRVGDDKNTNDTVDAGGSIEAYPTNTEAQNRAAYITKIESAMPAFAGEYDYVNGNTVLRISKYLTPAQATAYENAAR